MSKQYVFGYGSLASPEDAARTLGRLPSFIYPVSLHGWIRDWSVVIQNDTAAHRSVTLPDGMVAPGSIVVLNVRRPALNERATNPNGVLIEVTEADLRKLDARETHYDRHDVTADIVGGPAGIIYTYVGKDHFLLAQNTFAQAVIPADYSELVAQAFLGLGEAMHDTYVSSTVRSKLALSTV